MSAFQIFNQVFDKMKKKAAIFSFLSVSNISRAGSYPGDWAPTLAIGPQPWRLGPNLGDWAPTLVIGPQPW